MAVCTCRPVVLTRWIRTEVPLSLENRRLVVCLHDACSSDGLLVLNVTRDAILEVDCCEDVKARQLVLDAARTELNASSSRPLRVPHSACPSTRARGEYED
jgi:hypothetical protein